MRGREAIDIQRRAFEFAVRVVRLVDRVPRTVAGIEVSRQAVRAAMSVGANVEEADAAESKRDFVHRMGISHKEARESRYWLRVIQATLLDDEEVQDLIRENDELVRILYTIVAKARSNLRSKTSQ